MPRRAEFPLSPGEFVALIALLMALTALSVDIMLPALPAIGQALGVGNANDRQLVLTFYLLGFAGGQLIFGPLSDRFGRRPPIFFGLVLYLCATISAVASGSFTGLLVSRAFQGLGAAAPRVIAMAIVRDRFEGREMARTMSFITMVFVIVPILAPAIGEGILQFTDWRSIFYLLLIVAIASMIWMSIRLPETQAEQDRLPLSATMVWHAFKLVATTRQTLGYIIAMGFVFGLLFSYIISAEQVFVDTYGLGPVFPIVFASISCFMIAASVLNAAIVRRAGMRGLSHRALILAVAACAAMALMGYPEKPPLLLFAGFMATVFFCFGLIMPNFNALAMEPMGHIAGTASSIAGFYSTAAAAILGTLIGHSFDGTVRPLCIGITLLFLATLTVVLFTEKSQLFRHKPAVAAKIPPAN